MDIMRILQEFLKALDIIIVMGIILFVAGLRWVLNGFRVKIPDGAWRAAVLALGVGSAFLKVTYVKGWGLEVIKLGIAYGGAATLLYQMYRAIAKKIAGK